jgi:hypothetical protein
VAERMGLRQTYFIAGWVFLCSTLVIIFIRPQPIERPVSEPGADGRLLHRRYLAYLVAIFLAAFAMYLPQPLSPNFLQNQRDLTLGQIGQLYSLSSIGVVVLNLALGQLPARLGFLLGQAAVGSFALLLWQGSGLPAYALGYFMLGGFKTARSLGTAQVRELIHQARMGLGYGLTETVAASAIILTPPLAGYLYATNPVWMYALSVALVLVSLLAGARLSPSPGSVPAQDQTLTADQEQITP